MNFLTMTPEQQIKVIEKEMEGFRCIRCGRWYTEEPAIEYHDSEKLCLGCDKIEGEMCEQMREKDVPGMESAAGEWETGG